MNKLIKAMLLVVGFYYIAIGLYAYYLPEEFFFGGVLHRGELNIHFVKDAGAAYFVSGAMLLGASLYRPWFFQLIVGGCGFISIHAWIHVQDLIEGVAPMQYLAQEIIFVFLPNVVALAILLYGYKNRAVMFYEAEVQAQK